MPVVRGVSLPLPRTHPLPLTHLPDHTTDPSHHRCPINIRQQIWEGSETVFRRDLEPLIDAFVTDRAYHARSHDLLRWATLFR